MIYFRVPFAIASLLALIACAPPPPASPMERHARLAAAAEIAAQRCSAQLGGYQGVVQARRDADRNIATARQMGATDEVISKARQDVLQAYNAQATWTSPLDACNGLVGQLAWSAGS